MRKQPVAILLASILAISSAQAASPVRWEDLPQKLGDRKTREYTIVTKEGKAQRAPDLTFTTNGVTFSGASAEIPKEQVKEIRIHHHQAMGAASAVVGDSLFSGVDGGYLLLIPVALATYLATALPAVAVEGVRRALPDKVIKVEP
jgi:hypothetical protein